MAGGVMGTDADVVTLIARTRFGHFFRRLCLYLLLSSERV